MTRRWTATSWGPPDGWQLLEVELPDPRADEVTIRVRAAGVNPADAKHVAAPRPGATLPVHPGYEVSGEVVAVGAAATRFRIGDEVIAFRVSAGYSSRLNAPVDKVFAKPRRLSHAEAANLLLAGTTAAEMLAVVGAAPGETILLHGASGAVGMSVVQQAALRGIRVIGTTGEARAEAVEALGGIPVRYGGGLAERVRVLAGTPISAALDTAGTEEAIDVSLELVRDLSRIVTVAAPRRAASEGFRAIAGSQPESARFRDAARADLIALADSGDLVVPMARTFPLSEAQVAHRLLSGGHPGGKLALIP